VAAAGPAVRPARGRRQLGRQERAARRRAVPGGFLLPSHGTTFAEINAAHYSLGTELKHRNLIPTWSYLTYDGHAAGDNWFVSVDGDDEPAGYGGGPFPG
jgi:hypothetical protein